MSVGEEVGPAFISIGFYITSLGALLARGYDLWIALVAPVPTSVLAAIAVTAAQTYVNQRWLYEKLVKPREEAIEEQRAHRQFIQTEAVLPTLKVFRDTSPDSTANILWNARFGSGLSDLRPSTNPWIWLCSHEPRIQRAAGRYGAAIDQLSAHIEEHIVETVKETIPATWKRLPPHKGPQAAREANARFIAATRLLTARDPRMKDGWRVRQEGDFWVLEQSGSIVASGPKDTLEAIIKMINVEQPEEIERRVASLDKEVEDLKNAHQHLANELEELAAQGRPRGNCPRCPSPKSKA